MKKRKDIVFLGVTILTLLNCTKLYAEEKPVIVVASKTFTENQILAEAAAQVIEAVGEARVDRKLGFGDDASVHRALVTGAIDLYPDYTGTLTATHFKEHNLDPTNTEALRTFLEKRDLTITDSMGFNNTYALAMKPETVERLNIHKISDLLAHPNLPAAFSSGFYERADTYPGLQKAYGLDLKNIKQMNQALVYEAINNGDVELIDVYSTHPVIRKLGLTTLEDDKRFFPIYYAVLLASTRIKEQFPKTWQRLKKTFEGSLSEQRIINISSLVDLEGKDFPEAAAVLLGNDPRTVKVTTAEKLWTYTVEHTVLVACSLSIAIVVGLALGILGASVPKLSQTVLVVVGLIQTIPSLALLCFLIAPFGVGVKPAVVALFLYSLLPIVRNTYIGIIGIDDTLKESSIALGLTRWQRLIRIEIPMASPTIMTGIKTAAIINIGTATLAALIGAGGYGSPIVTGLSINNMHLVMLGAVPAALMALAMHGVFEAVDQVAIPKGLRLGS